jgi:hypothetical protein
MTNHNHINIIGLQLVGPGPGRLTIEFDQTLWADPRIRFSDIPHNILPHYSDFSEWRKTGVLCKPTTRKEDQTTYILCQEQEQWIMSLVPLFERIQLGDGLNAKMADLVGSG